MNVVSTRGAGPVSLSHAIAAGQAPDGGLYLPPTIAARRGPWGATLVERATTLLRPFFADDALADELPAIVRDSLTFDAPTRWLDGATGLLELFHGPTAAFKDFGARFLAACLARLGGGASHDASPAAATQRTVLVATSGDTGAAVAAAFWRQPSFRVVVLYPDGRVSPRQAHQLSAFGDNVTTFRVAGTFDDCQRLVKAAFADAALTARHRLVSANSISLGRLLPQTTYYTHAALDAVGQGRAAPNFVVPTGNLGNAFACLLARDAGLPIGDVVLATNANRVLPDFLASGRFEPRPSIATIANAMDVGAPSNLERLRAHYPDPAAVVRAFAVDDRTIRATIRETFRRHDTIVCPHTACGLATLAQLRAAGDRRPWIVAATAHPAKFAEVVEPEIGRTVVIPESLAALLRRPAHAASLAATDAALAAALAATGTG